MRVHQKPSSKRFLKNVYLLCLCGAQSSLRQRTLLAVISLQLQLYFLFYELAKIIFAKFIQSY